MQHWNPIWVTYPLRDRLREVNKAHVLIFPFWRVGLNLMELLLPVLNKDYFCFSEYLRQQSSIFFDRKPKLNINYV